MKTETRKDLIEESKKLGPPTKDTKAVLITAILDSKKPTQSTEETETEVVPTEKVVEPAEDVSEQAAEDKIETEPVAEEPATEEIQIGSL